MLALLLLLWFVVAVRSFFVQMDESERLRLLFMVVMFLVSLQVDFGVRSSALRMTTNSPVKKAKIPAKLFSRFKFLDFKFFVSVVLDTSPGLCPRTVFT
jgi:hypothetical protein